VICCLILTVFSDDLLIDPQEILDRNWDGIISHELFHQWFGNLVTCESWGNLALNEALASYGEQLWIEYKYGEDEAAYHGLTELSQYLDEAQNVIIPIIYDDYDDPESMFTNHTYAKGSRVMHMLRSYVGDDVFFRSLNHYLKTNAFGSVELSDLRKSFEFISGEDLRWFFHQWFLEPGHPELLVDHQHDSDTLYIEVTQQQDLNRSVLYRLPMYLDVFIGDSIRRYPLVIENLSHTFRVPLRQKPDAIILDADFQLLGILDHSKSVEELFYQLENSIAFQGRYEALTKLLMTDSIQLFEEVLKKGLSDPSERIQEITLSYISSVEVQNDSQIIEQVRANLNSRNSRIRGTALMVLIQNGWLREEEQLNTFLKDSSFYVQGVAIEEILYKNNQESF
jgi:aminopeptidase N